MDHDVIKARIKYVNKPIPLFFLFRALGIESDKEILECIFYDLSNPHLRDMMEILRPSLEETVDYNSTFSCLEWIGSRTNRDPT